MFTKFVTFVTSETNSAMYIFVSLENLIFKEKYLQDLK